MLTNDFILFRLPNLSEVSIEDKKDTETGNKFERIIKIESVRKSILTNLEKKDILSLRVTSRRVNKEVNKDIQTGTYKMYLNPGMVTLINPESGGVASSSAISLNFQKDLNVENKRLTLKPDLKDDFQYYSNIERKPVLSNTLAKLEIYKNIQKLDIPESLSKKIFDYLVYGRPQKSFFDCNAFIHFILDVPYEDKTFNDKYLLFNPLICKQGEINVADNTLSAGDAIMIFNDSGDACHAAVYLDKSTYISKFGNTGPLMITDLSNMRKLFDANGEVYKVTKK